MKAQIMTAQHHDCRNQARCPFRDSSSLSRVGSWNLPVMVALIALTASPLCHGAFALNFNGVTSTTVIQGASSITGQTPFTAVNANQAGELVVDPDTGISYWHYVMGDPASGFAQEVYIQASATTTCSQNNRACSASAGSTADAINFNILGNNSTLTGNGTGNPNRVIVRQIIGGTWDANTQTWTCDTSFCSEFIKSAYADKPKITQGINDTDFTSKFVIDMSGIALSNNTTDLTLVDQNSATTGASMINAQTVKDSAGNVVATFDQAKDAQTSYINGGKYTYTNGNGALGAGGTYHYVDGGYNLSTVDYTPFLDSTDANPWSFPAAKPQ
jgi:hypothetical protein